MESIMQSEIKKASQILSELDVPNIPEEVLKLKEELNKTYPNTVTIANLISHHPELLNEFLTLVNTNVTSEKTEIRDAKAAVNLLGLEEIFNLFVSTSLTSLLGQSHLEKEIITHGAKAGLAAAELSYWVFDVTRSEAYMAALMQNIGALFMARAFQNKYIDMFQAQLGNPLSAYQKELETYGTTHCFISVLLSKKWHIAPEVYKAILFHHSPDFAIQTAGHPRIKHITALMILANYTVASTSSEQFLTQELKEYRNLALSCLNLPENAQKAAVAAVQKWGNRMGLVTGSH